MPEFKYVLPANMTTNLAIHKALITVLFKTSLKNFIKISSNIKTKGCSTFGERIMFAKSESCSEN